MHVDVFFEIDPSLHLQGMVEPPGADKLPDLLCGGDGQPSCAETPDWASQGFSETHLAGRLTPIPQPATAMLVGGAMLGLVWLRRRRT